MYDTETEFKKFYYNHVVLPKKETTNLRKKKQLNIDRLISGLDDYNKKNNTNYKIAETLEQGSVAMATVTQNEENDYDIDIAIVFDESNIRGVGPIAIKNVIVDALKEKCKNFNTEPEAKTNCVRIVYSDNYHIDFAIYRRIRDEYDGSYTYEHAGSMWRPRNPRAINNWFKAEMNIHGEKLRQAVRLSKMFCKSVNNWNMPGGLIQSVLCDEKIQDYERIDEMFYYTMEAIKDRLMYNKEVDNPTDGQSLLLVGKDDIKVNNLYTRLNNKLDKLSILFNDECSYEEAFDAWHEFFNNDFWSVDIEKSAKCINVNESFSNTINEESICDDREEYIENIMPIRYCSSYKVYLDCMIIRNGEYYKNLKQMLRDNEKVKIDDELYFYVDDKKSNLNGDYRVYLKVKNIGYSAEINNDIRGDIFALDEYEIILGKYHKEYAKYEGNHFVECYIEANGICVAHDFLNVPIIK
ncbi:MAG: nucleotidyltransferase [Clostridium sp.]|uniref:nucleotidyltransferase n=1 Tax=Clostridium sp. TaxID=1506 RepID=UPI0028FE13E4|nr:nucleotidyltransferase [Clostridium sp.]MDU2895245.1 nucleotidyltransferase [Clostridium sp.]MDU3007044.1 nucleotidyltransferase [Clostridium sp.]MDU3036966.1 nucleotidyltransferase [Clostridium sp.]MDU3051289.1 nucleotidyltransferase [Clostridium sp.]